MVLASISILRIWVARFGESCFSCKKKKKLDKPDLGKKKKKEDSIDECNDDITLEKKKEGEWKKGERIFHGLYLGRDYVTGLILVGEEQSFIRWLVCGVILLMPLDNSLSLCLEENRARLVG